MRVQVLSPLYTAPDPKERLLPLALVIDDDREHRRLLAVLLAEAGCQVVEAESGAAGIEKLRESSPDLVILEAQMPGMDGWQTLEEIRRQSEVPVLMLTAAATEESKVSGLVGGADGYVTKPVAPAELTARVDALLRRSRRSATARRAPAADPGEETELEPGRMVGGYRIESLVAHGGMSSVYRATHATLARTVALKILSRELSSDRVSRERFMNEWRVARSLQHPNIVPVHDAGEADGMLYLAMELVESGDLAQEIARGALAPERAVGILEQVAAALDAAHAAHLVHRDVKPANVLLAGEHAYLTDFGLSKARGGTKLTAPGRMVGTAEYLAPEQIRGDLVDARADVYAFGCVVFEALTGSSPFEADSDYVLMFAHLERAAPLASERRPGLPAAVDTVIQRAMAKRREDRHASAGEVVADLKRAFGYE